MVIRMAGHEDVRVEKTVLCGDLDFHVSHIDAAGCAQQGFVERCEQIAGNRHLPS
jgi:hypothetical protein